MLQAKLQISLHLGLYREIKIKENLGKKSIQGNWFGKKNTVEHDFIKTKYQEQGRVLINVKNKIN